MKINIYSKENKVIGESALEKHYDLPYVESLVKQVFHVLQDKLHPGLNKVKTRSEVNISRRKIYKQKGTGGARHGAKSAHIFVGGGVVHGPTGFKRTLKLAKKMALKARNMLIGKLIKDGKAFVVSGLADVKSTKEAAKMVSGFSTKSVLVCLVETKKSLYFRNIKNVRISSLESANVYDLLSSSTILLDASYFVSGKESGSVKKTSTDKLEKRTRELKKKKVVAKKIK